MWLWLHCIWMQCLHRTRQTITDIYVHQGSSEHMSVVFMAAVFVTAVWLTALYMMAVFLGAVSALYKTECMKLQCSR